VRIWGSKTPGFFPKFNFLTKKKICWGKVLFHLLAGKTFLYTKCISVFLFDVFRCGKSTLLRVLAGKDDPDGGKVQFRKGIITAYVEQEPEFGVCVRVCVCERERQKERQRQREREIVCVCVFVWACVCARLCLCLCAHVSRCRIKTNMWPHMHIYIHTSAYVCSYMYR